MTLFRKFRTGLVSTAFFAVVVLAGPSPVLGSDPDGNPYQSNLAGQPICGHTTPISPCIPWPPATGQPDRIECHGIAYANVGGKMALITAGHCQTDGSGNYVSGNVIGPNDSIIGFWGGDYYGSRSHDVSVIFLYQDNWPSYRNRMIAGDPANGQYYTVTRADTPSSWGCSASPDLTGRTVYQLWQANVGDWTFNRTGTLLDKTGNTSSCTYEASLNSHYPNPDSGAPWMLQGHTDAPFAVSSAQVPCQCASHLIITPLYEGMADVNAYFLDHGGLGAHWCTSATCGGIGGY